MNTVQFEFEFRLRKDHFDLALKIIFMDKANLKPGRSALFHEAISKVLAVGDISLSMSSLIRPGAHPFAAC